VVTAATTPNRYDRFLEGRTVSTTWVFGLAFAVLTFVKRPVFALRPIFILKLQLRSKRVAPGANSGGLPSIPEPGSATP